MDESQSIFILSLGFIIAVLVWKGVKIVPQQQAWIVERLGRYYTTLTAGINFIVPFVDRIAYRHTQKEEAVDVPHQTAITKDNVSLRIDGVLYIKIINPEGASYGVSDPYYAISQLAQTTMRAEIGKLTLDKTFEEREMLNNNIVHSINEAAQNWGIQCMRYEIKDINPPETVLQAMELQVAAERKKRANILESEGHRQAQINIAEAQKAKVVLESEAAMTDQVNRAKGEAEAIFSVAQATAKGIEEVATAIQKKAGDKAVNLRIAEQYVKAFEKLAQESTTVLLPSNAGDIATTVAQALTIFDRIKTPAENA